MVHSGGTRLLAVALALALSGACALSRQSVSIRHSDPWKGALSLATGRFVEIELFDGTRTNGRLVTVDDTALSLETSDAKTERHTKSTVQRVRLILAGRDSLRNGVLTGAVAGLVYGIGVLAYLYSGSDDPAPGALAFPLLAAGAGGAVGAGVDALRQGTSKRTIYEAPKRSR